MSEIPKILTEAYEATDFQVLEPTEFTLNIGRFSDELKLLYSITNTSCAGFLTAWNPYSVETSDHENEDANLALMKKIVSIGLVPKKGLGKDPFGEWRVEESVFVLGLDFDTTNALGREFQQNAAVWAGPDAVPQLLLLR